MQNRFYSHYLCISLQFRPNFAQKIARSQKSHETDNIF